MLVGGDACQEGGGACQVGDGACQLTHERCIHVGRGLWRRPVGLSACACAYVFVNVCANVFECVFRCVRACVCVYVCHWVGLPGLLKQTTSEPRCGPQTRPQQPPCTSWAHPQQPPLGHQLALGRSLGAVQQGAQCSIASAHSLRCAQCAL